MVIGVVPRYDPHGMGMPSVRPDVAPGGRRRAVSISTVQAREVGGSHREHAATELRFRAFLLTRSNGGVIETSKTTPVSCKSHFCFFSILRCTCRAWYCFSGTSESMFSKSVLGGA